MQPIIEVRGLEKTYASGFQALKGVDLDIRRGEILALLGPNGAGKTTLISIVCGIVRATVSFSRGLFGKPPDPALIERILKDLSLWDKRDTKVMALSGGMKRRVLIAKALSHEPRILFLDEPTAGVDVELRRGMWEMIGRLRESGVTIILTTHYIEEAEEMADSIGVISDGRIILVEEKAALMEKLGKRLLILHLQNPLHAIPAELAGYPLTLSNDGRELAYRFDTQHEHTGIAGLLRKLGDHGIDFTNLHTEESSLEEIVVSLVKERT